MNKPLLTSRITDLSNLNVYCKSEPLIDSCDMKITNFGSCFAVHSSVQFNEVGLNSYYDGRNCFHYTTSSLKQVLEFCLLDSWNEDEWVGWCSAKQSYFSLAHRFISDPSKDSVIRQMNNAKEALLKGLKDSALCIVTIGTATYQKHLKTNKVVCHGNGLPQSEYELVSESVTEIQSNICSISDMLKSLCSSEVNLFENTKSKGHYLR